jgi:hypothetical protein
LSLEADEQISEEEYDNMEYNDNNIEIKNELFRGMPVEMFLTKSDMLQELIDEKIHVSGQFYKRPNFLDRYCNECKTLYNTMCNDENITNDLKGYIQHWVYDLPKQMFDDIEGDIIATDLVMGMWFCSNCFKMLYDFEYVEEMNCDYCKHELDIRDAEDLPNYDFISVVLPTNEQ